MAKDSRNEANITFMRRAGYLLTLAPAVFLVDFISKKLIQRTMVPYGETVPLIEGVARLRFIYNEGIAFGLHPGPFSGWLLIFISLAVTLTLIWYILFSGYNDISGLIGLCLITGGACGNLYDRIAFGQVVDFIEIGIRELTWPIFNVADMAVTCGAALLALRLFFHNPAPGGQDSGKTSPGEPEASPAVRSGDAQ